MSPSATKKRKATEAQIDDKKNETEKRVVPKNISKTGTRNTIDCEINFDYYYNFLF